MNFYLFAEGPLYQLYLWLGLAKKPLRLYQRRITIICLFTWLPLLVLTLANNASLHDFISDIDVHIRLLVSLALLLYAESFANERLQVVVAQFIKCNIITGEERQKFEAMVTSAVRLSSAAIAEIIIFLFVITVGRWVSHQVLPYDISAWYATNNSATNLTWAGYWYAFVSLPIFQFILLRWYYRVIIWFRFLWQVARLNLRLNSLHPDRAGGIGFLVQSMFGFGPFLMAHSVLLAGVILNTLLQTDMTLWQFKSEILTWTLLLVFIPVIPMIFFLPHMMRAKRVGTKEYDVFANHYVTDFRKKWIIAENRHHDALGSPDIQSLSDLSNSFDVSAHMKILPFSKRTLLAMLVVILLPFLPLTLTVMPLESIFLKAVNIVF